MPDGASQLLLLLLIPAPLSDLKCERAEKQSRQQKADNQEGGSRECTIEESAGVD